jgi:3-isopropylmalate dehydratase small subunit
VDPFRKHCLMNGLDEIGITLQMEDEIARFEQKSAALLYI